MATNITILSRPSKARDSVTVNWQAAHNPMPFIFQRYDLEVTNIEIASGTLKLTVGSDPETSPSPAYDVGDIISVKINNDNVTDGLYTITGFSGTYVIEAAAVDATLTSTAVTESYVFEPAQFTNPRLVVSIFNASTNIEITNITIYHFTNGVFLFDASPFVKSLLSNDNNNPYTSSLYADTAQSMGIYLKYQFFYTGGSDSQLSDSANVYYIAQNAKQIGDTYGQNLAEYYAFSSQTSVSKFLSTETSKRIWKNYPFSLSFINSSYVDAVNITELSNTGSELSNNDYTISSSDDTINQANILTINSLATKINVSLTHTPAFTFTVKTDNAGTSNSDQFTVPTESIGVYNCVVDWGDGNTSTITTYNDAAWTHTFAGGAGSYTIKITGTFKGIRFNNGGDKAKLTNISEWGALQFTNIVAPSTFHGCIYLTITATDIPDLSGLQSMYNFFKETTNLTTIPNIGQWDLSTITHSNGLANMFLLSGFNDPSIVSLNVSMIKSLSAMFYLSSFNQDIDSWDVSNVTDMSYLFHSSPFSYPLPSWNPINCTYFAFMLSNTTYNEQIFPLNFKPKVSIVSMFDLALEFNQDITGWDTSDVTDMSKAFYFAGYTTGKFKQDLSSWDFSSVTNMTNFNASYGDINNPNSADNQDNYNALLIKLDAAGTSNVVFSAGVAKYTAASAAATARANLIGRGWTITDGGAI